MEAGEVREPWERQEGESDRAFRGFTLYRELGLGRSIRAVAEELQLKSDRQCEKWSSVWRWRERVEAWDDHADARMRERDLAEREQALTEMKRRHLDMANAIQVVAAKGLRVIDTALDEAQGLGTLTAADVARLADIGTKLERLARGEATERMEFKQAQQFVDGLIGVALGYVPEDMHEAFLSDLESKLGVRSA